MGMKFNSGNGAYICDQCRAIVFENLCDYEWKALTQYETEHGEWFCKECCPECQKDQYDTYLKIINDNSPMFRGKQRAYIKELCDNNMI